MEEIHEGVYGNHSGGYSLAQKILRQGYFWPTMRKDVLDYARRCEKCQIFTTVPKLPAKKLTPIASSWPLAQWGIDIVGPLPMGKGQNKFALVTVV